MTRDMHSAAPQTAWIAADWGTSRLRVWAMDADNRPLAYAGSQRGMASLTPAEFEPALLELIAPVLGTGRDLPVLCCGMAGARQGWAEAPYRPVPCAPLAAKPVAAPVKTPQLTVHILPGVSQTAPPDAMRGEETQIAGFLAGAPDFDGVLCLPGTHSKWVQISAGEIVSFRTAMTGELFSLLAERSVLRHSVTGAAPDQAAFLDAVSDAMSRPESLSTRLFGLRAASLIAGMDGAEVRARLSGALIGAELAAMRPYWLGQQLVIIGAGDLAPLYGAALGAQGLAPVICDADDITLRGLIAARRALTEPQP